MRRAILSWQGMGASICPYPSDTACLAVCLAQQLVFVEALRVWTAKGCSNNLSKKERTWFPCINMASRAMNTIFKRVPTTIGRLLYASWWPRSIVKCVLPHSSAIRYLQKKYSCWGSSTWCKFMCRESTSLPISLFCVLDFTSMCFEKSFSHSIRWWLLMWWILCPVRTPKLDTPVRKTKMRTRSCNFAFYAPRHQDSHHSGILFKKVGERIKLHLDR